MEIQSFDLWKKIPGNYDEIPTVTAYIPDDKKSDAAIVVFPGGGYAMLAEHEGDGYARFLAANGYTAFVCNYRVAPYGFPYPLMDARRAVQFVRYNCDKYKINKNKIAVMGSSAGGHLAALVSTYYENEFEYEKDDIDLQNFIPNAQILCYPVIKLFGKNITHLGSGKNLLQDMLPDMGEELSPDLIASKQTPNAFIWHTFDDEAVNVINSLDYAKSLKNNGVDAEVHIFPNGPHGMGIPNGKDKISKHVVSWSDLLIKWLNYINF